MNIKPDNASKELTSGIKNLIGAIFGVERPAARPRPTSLPARSTPPRRPPSQNVTTAAKSLPSIDARIKALAKSAPSQAQNMAAKKGSLCL